MRKYSFKSVAFVILVGLGFSAPLSAVCPPKESFTNAVFDVLRQEAGSEAVRGGAGVATIDGKNWRVTKKSHNLPNTIEFRTRDKFRKSAAITTAQAPGSIRCIYTYPVSRLQTKTIGADESRYFEITTVD